MSTSATNPPEEKSGIHHEDFIQIADCTAFNLRKASRVVSQLFDDALRDSGLRGGQFSIMSMILYHQPLPVKALADHLVMDRTTLTRNLKPLERDGLITIEPGSDRRVREVSVTNKGRDTLTRAYPRWKKAQAKMIEGMGDPSFQELLSSLRSTVQTVQDAPDVD